MTIIVIGIASAGAAIGSLIFVGVQTRELIRQTRHANAINTASAIHAVLDRLHQANLMIINQPELLPYFYENRPCPRSGRRRARIQMVLEVIADALNYGLAVKEVMPDSRIYIQYDDYIGFLLERSPILRVTLREHPEWWRHIYKKYIEESIDM